MSGQRRAMTAAVRPGAAGGKCSLAGSAGPADGKIAGLYDLEETIGRGHYAVVKLARHVFTGEKVAVKVIDKTKLDEVSRAHLFQEVRCMKLVQHPHVVRLYEVIDTATRLYLVLEWGDGGDLYDYIMKHDGGLNEDLARRYFAQIVQAIDYCHRLHVVHRDLKPENVVFFETSDLGGQGAAGGRGGRGGGGIVKLTDFGFSNKFVPGRKLETSCGSLAYSAPEILLGDSYDAPAVDIWSLGVILYMLVCGEPPFQEANDSETLTMIMDCRYRIPDRVSRLCQDIIGRMLVREPSQRATLSDIAAHPWMTSQLDSAAASSHVGNSSPSPSPPLLLSSNAAPVVTSTTPLVCHETLSDEDHCHIVQRIVDGKIATRDEVLGSLESSAYNYITATYYLLAERMLRKRVEAAASSQQLDGTTSGESSNGTSVALTPVLSPLMLSPRMSLPMSDGHHSIVDSLISPTGVTHLPSSPAPVPHGPMSPSAVLHSEINLLMCRCAMIHEDSLEVGTVDDADDDEGTNITMIDQTHSDSEVTADEGAGSDSCESLAPLGNLLEIPSMRGSKLASGISRPLVSVRSSPQLLNEICEEAESVDNEDEAPNSGSGIVATPASHFLRRHSTEIPRHLERLHRVHRRKLATLVPRVASCSSSDASDTDEAEQRKHRKHKTTTTHGATPSCIKNLGRRDSSEHSSDNDNQPPAVGGGDSGSAPSSSTGLLGSGGSTQRHESQHSGDRHRGGHMDSLHEHHMETGYSSDISVSTDINELADGCAPWDIGYLPSQRFSDCHLSDRRRRRGCGIGGIFRDPSVVSDWQQMNERNQLSNVMRFCSNEFGQFVEKLGPARPAAGGNISGGGSIPFSSGMKRWQSASKFHSHSKVDLRRETHAVAAALLARLSGTDVLRCRLRTRKVSL